MKGLGMAGVSLAVMLTVAGATVAHPSAANAVRLKVSDGAATCFSTPVDAQGPIAATDSDSPCGLIIGGAALGAVPGGNPTTTTVTLTNVGSVKTSGGTLATGNCGVAAANATSGYRGDGKTSLCTEVDVEVELTTGVRPGRCLFPKNTVGPCTSTPPPSGVLARFADGAYALPPLSPGSSASVTIRMTLNRTTPNTDQGLEATVPVTWSIHE